MIHIEGETHLLDVEGLGPLDIGDRQDHQLQLPIHRVLPGSSCWCSPHIRGRSAFHTATGTLPRWFLTICASRTAASVSPTSTGRSPSTSTGSASRWPRATTSTTPPSPVSPLPWRWAPPSPPGPR